MRERIHIFLLVIVAILSTSCTEKEAPAPQLESSITRIEAEADGGTFPAIITSNYEWTADGSAGWVHLSRTSGPEGSTGISITVDSNPDYIPRSAEVSIRSRDINKTISINQAKKEEVIQPDNPGGGKTETFADTLMISHYGGALSAPVILGTSVEGLVDWGDGCPVIPYSDDLVHDYTQGKYVLTLYFNNGAGFHLEDVQDGMLIDLSGF